MNPTYTTIITPIIPDDVAWLRDFLRENADPQPGTGDSFLVCRPLFRFDTVAGLHFCSFVIIEADGETAPSLVFEATFDGAKSDFLDEVLRVAAAGFDAIYRCCEGYPSSGSATGNLVKEYLIRHDVGANTYFSGNPGRTVAQIKGESRIRNGIVSFLSRQFWTDAVLPGRPAGLRELITRECIRGTELNRWAEQPARTPWQVTFRREIAGLAAALAFAVVCCLGYLVVRVVGLTPSGLLDELTRSFGSADRALEGDKATLPWIWEQASAMPFSLAGGLLIVSVTWLIVRTLELVLSSASRNTRDQGPFVRVALQLAVLTRYVLVAAIGGVVALALLVGADNSPVWTGVVAAGVNGLRTTAAALAILAGQLFVITVIVCIAWHYATSLRLMVEIQPLPPKRENLRRLALDVLQFAMAVLGGVAILLLAALIPNTDVGGAAARVARSAIHLYFITLLLAWVGIAAAYAMGFLALCLVGLLERHDRSSFDAPAGLLASAGENAQKYQREEGGINRYQNHLASITCVKPGVTRRWILRFVLFAINILAKFWFNKGDLGGIPTILSARWVMIDGGKRLLFLDNFGGAWESYLNEFIDLPAVKGLNAIWTNTFVNAGGRRYGFPATRFLFWAGAQDARPFKAYVRQGQIETLAWYGAYPTLGVIAINANTDTRQALFAPLNTPAIDQLIQRL